MAVDVRVIPTKDLIEGGLSPEDVCSGCGEPLSDHNLKCRLSRIGLKGTKGRCTFCGGAVHNDRDKYQLQEFWCLWIQCFRDEAGNRRVNDPETMGTFYTWYSDARRKSAPDKEFKPVKHPITTAAIREAKAATPEAPPETLPMPEPAVISIRKAKAEAKERDPDRKARAKAALKTLAAGGGVR